MLQVWEMLS